ncbi:hypothetical protein [Streptomyces zhihengii]|uniref:Uncharacterized protein n=1 Tax=Streptomyces zhihengii TaxID=1818004 RepID=A0ABS2V526_9ACTN|nr:hypothetical protein [Streptomyces zhihengii]MBM9624764.1 hypothetical protein [Streptomyces zhihengii]
MSPVPDERDRIRAPMERILADAIEYSNGALTIVALAQEAQVSRTALTQRHLDLKNELYDKVRARGAMPDSEKRLRHLVTELMKLRAADAKDSRDYGPTSKPWLVPCTRHKWRTGNCVSGSPLQAQSSLAAHTAPAASSSGTLLKRQHRHPSSWQHQH